MASSCARGATGREWGPEAVPAAETRWRGPELAGYRCVSCSFNYFPAFARAGKNPIGAQRPDKLVRWPPSSE